MRVLRRETLKRIFDLTLALFSLVLLAPLFIILFLVIRKKLGSPVFFKQERGGLNGLKFNIIKFRTMSSERNASGELLSDDKRLSAFGLWLRNSSLDELPEILNILAGDMSFVGPRPLMAEYLKLYSPHQSRRHNVKPGITGWAQVCGRNSLSWDEKFKLDLWYVENWNFLLDLKILFLTVQRVLKKEGVSANDHATMPKFTGTEQGELQ